MTNGLMHFGRYSPTKEELYIVGYNPTANQVLVIFPDYLRREQRDNLRDIIMTTTAQDEDYLAKILQNEKFISDPTRVWLDVLFNDMFKKGSKAVRSTSLKDVDFDNEGQGAFFRGFGEPKNPENNKKNKHAPVAAPAVDMDDIVAKVTRTISDQYGDLMLKQDQKISELTAMLGVLVNKAVAEKAETPKVRKTTKKQLLTEKPELVTE